MPKFLLALFIFLASIQVADAIPDPVGQCDRAARRASRLEGVPLDVLKAISRVETGRAKNGRLEPWPWTVNVEGRGYWFATESEAKTHFFDVFQSGISSFDVGCFQINYRWHGKAFRSIDAMFDPDENARYAARFLKELFAELGSWPRPQVHITHEHQSCPRRTGIGSMQYWLN